MGSNKSNINELKPDLLSLSERQPSETKVGNEVRRGEAVIAIFDVGKTNKKLFLFDEHYRIVFEKTLQFTETVDEDGDPCENLEALTEWGRNSIKELIELGEFDIKALNFSAYGASFVHIDEEGKTITPLYNYLKPFPEDLKKKFYKDYGGEIPVSMITASPVLGNLNSGMQLYWLKYKQPGVFKKIHYSLHLPQYLSYLITGQAYSDITSIGCHTNLWNFPQHNYHEWVLREGIVDKLAPVFSSADVVDARAFWKDFKVGIGLHDSCACGLPGIRRRHPNLELAVALVRPESRPARATFAIGHSRQIRASVKEDPSRTGVRR